MEDLGMKVWIHSLIVTCKCDLGMKVWSIYTPQQASVVMCTTTIVTN